MEIFEGFLGSFQNIQGTAGSDMATNSVVTLGPFRAVTHQAWKSGETYTAYMSAPVSVYGFELATTAADTVSVGTPMYVTSSGTVTTTATSNTYIGVLWQAIAAGDTLAAVALLNETTTASIPAATTSAAGLMSGADKEKLDGIGVATTTKAGLVKPDGVTIDVAETTGVISVHST